MIQSRLEMEDYTARVLDVIKGKYGLKNRSEALNILAKAHGDSYVEPVTNPDVLKELDKTYENHKKKHPRRRMKNSELKELMGI